MNPSVLKALSGTCRGKADRKVPEDIIGKRGLGVLGFAPVAWSCLGVLGFAWAFVALLEFDLSLPGFPWFACGCLVLLGFARVCII